MDVTTFLAVLGAITGTSALFWDVYKWRNAGPKLRVHFGLDFTVNREAHSFTKEQFVPPNPYLLVKLVNIGQSKTTVERLEIVIYEDKRKKKNYEEKARLIYMDTHLGNLPYTLEPAQRWIGALPQTPDLEYSIEKELVFLEIFDTYHVRPTVKRLRRRLAEEMFGSFIARAIPMDHTSTLQPVALEPRYRVEAQPMKSGDLWQVIVFDRAAQVNKLLSGGRVYEENLSEDKAAQLANELRNQLASRAEGRVSE